WVVEPAALGVRPARADRIGKRGLANDARVDGMLAVEIDAIPIDEPIAGPGRDGPERIMVVHQPAPAARDAPGAVVEPYRNALVCEVTLLADLDGRHHARPVIHARPRLDARRFGSAVGPFRQGGEVGVVYLRVLTWIVRLEIGFANEVNDVVFLLGHHPGL